MRSLRMPLDKPMHLGLHDSIRLTIIRWVSISIYNASRLHAQVVAAENTRTRQITKLAARAQNLRPREGLTAFATDSGLASALTAAAAILNRRWGEASILCEVELHTVLIQFHVGHLRDTLRLRPGRTPDTHHCATSMRARLRVLVTSSPSSTHKALRIRDKF